ncbi:hypothetical protein NPJ82_17910 (plasmid) [Sphingomonas sp. NY01]|uniref:hypothetical protein n=1 Tax=Sphingomonas sp. NY01 TaxID=2968057 RepID=UPI0033676B3A
MGHFVDHDRPYQMHVIPYETRVLGPTRRFVEYVAPFGTRYAGKLYVAGGRWTGSMGEGLMIGFDAIGATTVGSDLPSAGCIEQRDDRGFGAKVDIGTEQLFTVTGLPREAYRPQIYLAQAERTPEGDPFSVRLSARTFSIHHHKRDGLGRLVGRSQSIRKAILISLAGGLTHTLPARSITKARTSPIGIARWASPCSAWNTVPDVSLWECSVSPSRTCISTIPSRTTKTSGPSLTCQIYG